MSESAMPDAMMPENAPVPAVKPAPRGNGKPRDAGAGPVRVAGHLGELLQGRLGPGGPVVLVTLPCPPRGVVALCQPGPLSLHQPGERLLDLARLRALLRALDLPVRGRFVLHGSLPPGGGAGASTAALVAVARAAGVDGARLIAACLAVEGASDPLMFAQPGRLLWASRQGRVLARLPPLPGVEVLGGFHGPPQRTDPRDAHFADVADLVAVWPAACADPARLAALATEAARRTLSLRGPRGDATAALAARLGALGYAIGHTGPARALLFRPGTVPPGAGAALAEAGFTGVIRYRIGGDHA